MTFQERMEIACAAAASIRRLMPQFERDELISEAYVRGGVMCSEQPPVVFKACMQDMLNFIRDETREANRVQSLEAILDVNPNFLVYEHRSIQQVDNLDEISFLFRGMPYQDRALVYLRYWTTYTAFELALQLRTTRERLKLRLHRVLCRVREKAKKYKRRK